jgi:hypothetical protein
MANANISWDTIGPFLVWQFLIPLVGQVHAAQSRWL